MVGESINAVAVKSIKHTWHVLICWPLQTNKAILVQYFDLYITCNVSVTWLYINRLSGLLHFSHISVTACWQPHIEWTSVAATVYQAHINGGL